MITFVPRNNYEHQFDLILGTDMMYPEIVFKLASTIQCEPSHIRLITPDVYGAPKMAIHPIDKLTLLDIIQTIPMSGPINIFFDVLTMSLSEFEKKKLIRLNICYPKLNKVNYTEIIIQNNTLWLNVKRELKERLQVRDQDIRFFTVENNKFKSELKMENLITEQVPVYVELVPQEEFERHDQDFYINVYHYQRDIKKSHSVPFKFLIIKNEVFKDTKRRLQNRTGLDDNDWCMVKCNIVSTSSVVHIEDDYILGNYNFSENDSLGLDHYNNALHSSSEKSLFIKE